MNKARKISFGGSYRLEPSFEPLSPHYSHFVGFFVLYSLMAQMRSQGRNGLEPVWVQVLISHYKA